MPGSGRVGAMQVPGYELPRIPVPRTSVNRAPRKRYMYSIPGAIPPSNDITNSTTPPATMTTSKGPAMR
jgi:hypothetical protein